MNISVLEDWVTAHGLPMVITLLAIYIVFRYFLKQLDKPTKTCTPSIDALKVEVVELGKKIDANSEQVSTCKNTLIQLKGFLSGVYFRNKGLDDD